MPPGGGVAVSVGVEVLVGVFVGATVFVFVGVLVGAAVLVFVAVGVIVGVFVMVGVLVAVEVLVGRAGRICRHDCCVCWRVAGRDRYSRRWRRQWSTREVDQQLRCACAVQSLQVEQPGTCVVVPA